MESLGYQMEKKKLQYLRQGWAPLLWHFYQEITSELRVKEIIILLIIISITTTIIIIIIIIIFLGSLRPGNTALMSSKA